MSIERLLQRLRLQFGDAINMHHHALTHARPHARTHARHGVRGITAPWRRNVTMCPCGTCADCSARHRLSAALRLLGRERGDGRIAHRLSKRRHRPATDERPRCGAKCRDGRPCSAPAVWRAGDLEPRNGRCRNHGGLSTGPRTAEGKRRSLEALRTARERRATTESQAIGGRGKGRTR